MARWRKYCFGQLMTRKADLNLICCSSLIDLLLTFRGSRSLIVRLPDAAGIGQRRDQSPCLAGQLRYRLRRFRVFPLDPTLGGFA